MYFYVSLIFSTAMYIAIEHKYIEYIRLSLSLAVIAKNGLSIRALALLIHHLLHHLHHL
jgi:hypothetical protein